MTVYTDLLSGDELYRVAFAMDLQWFAAEDEGRTQDPTEVTYRKARQEGRVAKSQELIAALGLLLPAIALVFLAPLMLRTCTEMLKFFFTRINELDPLKDRLTARIFIIYFIQLSLPILAVAVVTALFSNLIQTGFLFSTKPLEPDFSKVLPKFGKYFQRTLFSVEGIFNFFKSIIKMGVIGVVAYFIVSSKIKELVNLQTVDLWKGVTLIASLASQLLIVVALLLLFLSIPDLLFQRWQFKQSLKMTRQAAKEEIKQDEGDQQMRSRLRSRYRELLSRNMINAVPNADVVITNPTHYSVALEFDIERMSAPTVIAKGEDDFALRIREVAKENGVPVVSHPPLTRAIYQETEVGEQIPIRFYQVVALFVGKFFHIDEQNRKKAQRDAERSAGRMGA